MKTIANVINEITSKVRDLNVNLVEHLKLTQFVHNEFTNELIFFDNVESIFPETLV